MNECKQQYHSEIPEGQPANFVAPDWGPLVERIQRDDPSAVEELYAIFGKGIRYFLQRNLGVEELDDKVHDCFVVVLQAIKNGELRDPVRLMGYVRTVVKRQIADTIEAAVNRRRTQVDDKKTLFTFSDWKEDPEKSLLARQRAEIARRVLDGVSSRDREILSRFYLDEQPMEQICNQMGLSYNQFRLLKSRAKARFAELGKRLATSHCGAGLGQPQRRQLQRASRLSGESMQGQSSDGRLGEIHSAA